MAGDYIRLWMQESLYQTANAGVSISDTGCRRLYIRQRMQETLYQTADAGVSINQQVQETLYQTADERDSISVDAVVSISDSGCRSLYI